MVEIEQEELDRLRNIEESYNRLSEQHTQLENAHNTLKDDYIELSKGQRESEGNKETDLFDDMCKQRFGK